MKNVDFYFDVISPYAWLARRRIDSLQFSKPVRFNAKPVLFAALLDANGQKGPAEIPAKREYTMKDVMRWATKLGYVFKGPPAHPFNPLKALRCCAAVDDDAKRWTFSLLLLEACWSRGSDLTQDETLAGLAEEAGLAGSEILNLAGESVIKERVKQAAQQALAQGVFGVPTLVADNEIFWGHDRLELLQDYLQGSLQIDTKQLTHMLSRPRAADRKSTAVGK